MSDTAATITEIEAAVFDIMDALEHLAPHPDNPDYRGPVFVQADSSFKPPAEYDSMAALTGAQGFLASAFSSAVSSSFGSWAGKIDWSDTLESTSAILQDRAHDPWSRSVRSSFNTIANDNPLMAAFRRDLPRRMGLERMLADYLRYLAVLRNRPVLRFVPSMAA